LRLAKVAWGTWNSTCGSAQRLTLDPFANIWQALEG